MEASIRHAMAPTAEEIRAQRLSTNAAVAAELLGRGGGRALDVGCGDGTFTRALAGLFREVGGIDVRASRIDDARAAAQAAGVAIDFRVAGGEALPYADASFDVVAFSNSLHHMADIAVALREAARVLAPNGLLYVMEPVPSGTYHEATRLVNDETIVRTAAYRALASLAEHGLAAVAEVMYRARHGFADFAEWKADQIDRDANRQTAFDAQPDEVRRRFESNADRENGRLAFDQVFRVNLLRKNPTQ
jgi:ubiquinone/menaquinone biosynthesis C-methylase UbiE